MYFPRKMRSMCHFTSSIVAVNSRPTVLVQYLTTSTCMLKTKRKKIKIGPKNFVETAIKGMPKFVARHLADPYVKKRFIEGYRCRSAFKLKEIDDEYLFLKPGTKLIDMGACPGSWSQVAAERIFPVIGCDEDGSDIYQPGGLVIAIDLLKFQPIENVYQITGDFTDISIQEHVVQKVQELDGTSKVDVVICDAATKASGIVEQDCLSLVRLIVAASPFVLKVLKPGGTFLFKIRNGSATDQLRDTFSKFFGKVKLLKPPASRQESAEMYLLCLKFRQT